MASIRRVVSGWENGRSVFVSDERRPSVVLSSVPGFEFNEVWTTPACAAHPGLSQHTPSHGYLPQAGGTQFQIVTFPPDAVFASPGFDAAAAAREQMALFPGVAAHFEPDHPGMHATPTVDYAVVLHGSVVLELDDGASAILGPGDVAVQNGARHAWRNPGDEPVTLAFVLIGDAAAKPEGGAR